MKLQNRENTKARYAKLHNFFPLLPHTWLILAKRFTNLKVNLKCLGFYIGAKMQLVSYDFEYFYQCIMTRWGLRDSKGPTLMHQAHLVQN